LETKHANNRNARRQHIPVHPSPPNPDFGSIVLRIDGESLKNNSWVKIENTRTCSLKSLRPYGRRKLTSDSFTLLMKYALPRTATPDVTDLTSSDHHTLESQERNSARRLSSYLTPYPYGTSEPRESRRTYGTFVNERPSRSTQPTSWLRRIFANPRICQICGTAIKVLISIAFFYLLVAGTIYAARGLWSWMKSLGLGLKNWVVETAQGILKALRSWISGKVGSLAAVSPITETIHGQSLWASGMELM
jgi:hypothetical protein